MAIDITQLRNVSSGTIRSVAETAQANMGIGGTEKTSAFQGILDTAVENIYTTNSYLSDAENEEIKWALGETESTHDLAVALQKASTALQFTIAIRDKLMEAYKEIMQMQI